jgi:hypothetical protein
MQAVMFDDVGLVGVGRQGALDWKEEMSLSVSGAFKMKRQGKDN